jgi:aryl-alcohol dehydrogenase-like predicted oxidoreductase
MSVTSTRPSVDDSVRVLLRAAELGVTLWDTADAYCIDDTETGHNERIFAAALKQLPADLRAKVIVATKGGHVRPSGRWDTDGRPEHLREAVDASLKALGVDQIDLYQFHRPDPKVPFEDSVAAVAEAHAAGKVRWVGLSNVSAAQIDVAVKIVPVASVQNQYSPKHRNPERDGVLAKCQELGLAFLPYSPLGGMGGAKAIGETGKLGDAATELGVSPQQVVLAWLLSKYERVIPIPGASRIASVEDCAGAADLALTPELIAALDASFA